ncbi:MAG: glycosyltransferase [Chloroflexi bacterium]|nr:glycosyltransferase [Chloroflexota bacterium]
MVLIFGIFRYTRVSNQQDDPTLRAAIKHLKRLAPWLTPQLVRFAQYPPRPLNLAAIADANQSSEAIANDLLPPISIVTPSYNQAQYVERTLLSVLNQDYPQLEYVVQDGVSTDGSQDVLEGYRQRLTRLIIEPDQGQGDAVNRGFHLTNGLIMAFLNSDDLLLPGALRRVGSFFAAKPQVDVVYSHRLIIDQNDQEIGRWILPPHNARALTWVDYVPQETLFWRRHIWDAVGGIDPTFRYALDWDLLLRFQAAGARFARLPAFLGAFRVYPEQKTSAWNDIGEQEKTRLRERHHRPPITSRRVWLATRPYMLRQVITAHFSKQPF